MNVQGCNMVIKVASYWSRFDGTPTESTPTLADIQRIAFTGFDALMIGEITYGDQMQNIDDCINSRNGWTPTNNPITTAIQQIKDNGMEPYYIMNPNRYNGVANLLDRPADKAKFVNHLAYIGTLGVTHIELEEFQLWYDYFLDPVSGEYVGIPNIDHMRRTKEYMQELKSVIPSSVKLGFNCNSNMYINIQASGINPPDANLLLDFAQPQPGKGPAPDYLITNQIIQNAVNNYKLIFPNLVIRTPLYQQYSCGNATGRCINVNLISNIQYCVLNGINFTVWPVSSVSASQFELMRPILLGDNNCPPPQYNYIITQS